MNPPVCLACELVPLCRADFDGLCISCRAAVADELYRIEWVYPEPASTFYLIPVQCHLPHRERFGLPDRPYRVIVFASLAEHPLGVQWPSDYGPKLYDPKAVRDHWREMDRLQRERTTAETVLETLTVWG